MSAMATQSLRFMPPERFFESLAAYGVSSICTSTASTSARTRGAGTPRSRAKSRRCARHESRSQSVFCCATTPSRVAARAKSSSTEWPPTCASPAVGYVARMTQLIAVDLPAPLAPSSPKSSPRATRNVRLRTAASGGSAGSFGG